MQPGNKLSWQTAGDPKRSSHTSDPTCLAFVVGTNLEQVGPLTGAFTTSNPLHCQRKPCSRHVVAGIHISRTIVKALMVYQDHTHANETIMAIEPDMSQSRISNAISRLMPRLENVTRINNSLRKNDCFNRILTIIAVLPIYRTIIQQKRNCATCSAAVINHDLTLESN